MIRTSTRKKFTKIIFTKILAPNLQNMCGKAQVQSRWAWCLPHGLRGNNFLVRPIQHDAHKHKQTRHGGGVDAVQVRGERQAARDGRARRGHRAATLSRPGANRGQRIRRHGSRRTVLGAPHEHGEQSRVFGGQMEGPPKLRNRSNQGNSQVEGTPEPRKRPNRGNAEIEGTLKPRERSN